MLKTRPIRLNVIVLENSRNLAGVRPMGTNTFMFVCCFRSVMLMLLVYVFAIYRECDQHTRQIGRTCKISSKSLALYNDQ